MTAGTVVATGTNGFVGRHLVRELSAHGWRVAGVGLDKAPAPELDGLLTSYDSVDLTVGWPDLSAADAVVHLAGLSAVGPSFDRPQAYIETNSAMVTGLGEALAAGHTRPRVLLVSSGAVYDARQPVPIAEDGAVAVSSPYAVSKLLVEHQAAYYRSRGQDWLVARPFNHIGPGQGSGFLVPDLYAALRTAEVTGTSMRVGDLTTRRDYTDVRDVVRAYRLLLGADGLAEHVFNVCSASSRSGEEVLARLLGGRLGPALETDPSRLRPNDPRDVRGDNARLMAVTGWRPEIAFERSIDDFVAQRSAGRTTTIG
jgi:GDP-4-dehydro-6-deoxy-D-mannose reductase